MLVALLDSGQDPASVLARPRSLLSADATIEILKKRPLSDAIAVVDRLFAIASEGTQPRQSFIHLAGKIMNALGISPRNPVNPFPITMIEYSAIAAAFSKSHPPMCPVRVGSSQTVTREYSLFYQWHLTVWCGIGSTDRVSYSLASSVLIRKYCLSMVYTALEAAERLHFPAELVEMIVRKLVESN